jgi:hypothetical protein
VDPLGSARGPDFGLHDLARVRRWLALGKRVNMLHAALDLAPDGILPVEKARVVETDEELAVGAVRIRCAGHRAGAADVRLAAELGLEVGTIGSTGAAARRIAALGHEAGNDPVEGHAVVETALRQRLDALDMAGRKVGPELDYDVAAAGEIEDKAVVVGHRSAPVTGKWGAI